MKLFIKTPFPGESVEDAPWTECTTPHMRYVWYRHKENKGKKWALPTKKE